MPLFLTLLLSCPLAAQPADLAPLTRAHQEARRLLAEHPLDEDRDEARSLEDGKAVPLPNLHRVSEGLYRSGQPNREGLAMIQALGVKTILTLRLGVEKDELDEAERLGMRVENVRMNGVLPPRYEEVDRALAILARAPRPILVHCLYGRDRTGVVIAAYRVAVEGIPAADAAKEALAVGCCPPTFPALEEYLSGYLRHRKP